MLVGLVDYDGEEEVFNISANRGTSQKEILEFVKSLELDFCVKYVEGRSVDAKKIILDNSKIRTVYREDMVTLEEGIKKYYQYLTK